MRTATASMLKPGVIALALTVCLLPGCTFEQILIGQWYTIETPAADACPALVWRFAVDPQHTIGGSLSRDGQQAIGDLAGKLAADDSFQITVTDVAGNRTANVTGQFTSQVSTISIHGDAAGSGCNGQSFKLRLGRYFASSGGGGGGGGR